MSNSFNVSVKADFKELERQLKAAQQKTLRQATSSALNRAIVSERAEAVRQVRNNLAIKQTYARREFQIHKATPMLLVATMTIKHENIGLRDYPFHVGKHGNRYKKGTVLTAHEYVSKGFTPQRNSFAMQVHGTQVIAHRAGASRLPTKQTWGPRVDTQVVRPNSAAAINAAGAESYKKNLEHELKRRLERQGFTVTT